MGTVAKVILKTIRGTNLNIIKKKKYDMKTIEINGQDYKIKYTIRSLFIWEQITGKPFKIENLLDNYIFFYSMILANNQDMENIISWDDFLDALDKEPDLFSKMNEAVEAQQKKDDIFQKEEDDSKEGEGKKKSKRK